MMLTVYYKVYKSLGCMNEPFNSSYGLLLSTSLENLSFILLTRHRKIQNNSKYSIARSCIHCSFLIIILTEITICKMYTLSVLIVLLMTTFSCVNSYHLRHVKRSFIIPDISVNTTSQSSEKYLSKNATEEYRIRGKPALNQPKTVPAYLSLMYEKLSAQKMPVSSSEGFGDILRALFPSAITSGEFGSGFLVFNVNPEKVGNYSSAHLILTRNGKIDNHSQSHVNVNIQFQNQESILSQRILENERFYTFDITSLFQEVLKETEGETSFDLKCDVFKNIRRKKIWFDQVFDTETEKPFIIFEYQDVDMARFIGHQDNPEESQNRIPERKRRSLAVTERSLIVRTSTPRSIRNRNWNSSVAASVNVTGVNLSSNDTEMLPSLEPPVKTVCRRHEWLATPAEVGLDDVIKPEKLDLGFCGGSCPYPLLNDFFNFTLHSYFVDHHRLLKGFNVPNGFPLSNCVPVTYKPLMVMEVEEDGGYLLRTYMEASVDSCGCR